MPGQALRLIDQLVAEQPPRGRLAVAVDVVDVVEDEAVVLQPSHPPDAACSRVRSSRTKLQLLVDVGGSGRVGRCFGTGPSCTGLLLAGLCPPVLADPLLSSGVHPGAATVRPVAARRPVSEACGIAASTAAGPRN
ncbi:hypothetical protein ACFVYR_20400 [Streptomyces sp. NPDC058284]|uniref:hypothetical protein n=1 Tax=unclassified Streptomyces TaxID=2593676 RepID=UPI00364A705C